ncbi:MAG: glycoside hydrolase family 5 protein, partial [Fibrobacterota bacterium]
GAVLGVGLRLGVHRLGAMADLERQTLKRLVAGFGVAVLAGCGGLFHSDPKPVAGGLVEKHGKLKVVGRQLSDAHGVPMQLRGVSFFWINWHEENLKNSAVEFMVDKMGATVVRIPVPAFEYAKGGATWDAQMRLIASWVRSSGAYVVIDWHMEDDPNTYLKDASLFWDRTSAYFAGDPHVIYEICNEPKYVSWPEIKSYAQKIIPIIRKNDSNTVIIVGTPEWSRRTAHAAADPLTVDANGDSIRNVMYTYHGYAATHGMADDLRGVLEKVPVFATEWSVTESSGNGRVDWQKSRRFVEFLNTNPYQKVSWSQWSWVDKNEKSALLKAGSGGLSWELSEVGDTCAVWIKEPGRTDYPDFAPKN